MSRSTKNILLVASLSAYIITGVLVVIIKNPEWIGMVFYITVGIFFANYVVKEIKAGKTGEIIEDEMSENQRNQAGLRALIQSYYLWFLINVFYDLPTTPFTIGLLGMFLLFVINFSIIKKVA
jgi:hypothetical protein